MNTDDQIDASKLFDNDKLYVHASYDEVTGKLVWKNSNGEVLPIDASIIQCNPPPLEIQVPPLHYTIGTADISMTEPIDIKRDIDNVKDEVKSEISEVYKTTDFLHNRIKELEERSNKLEREMYSLQKNFEYSLDIFRQRFEYMLDKNQQLVDKIAYCKKNGVWAEDKSESAK